MATLAPAAADRSEVLTSAIARIAELWGLSNAKLAAILGLSPATVSRLRHGQARLDPASKSFEAGQFLLRLFRSLDALLGSDDDAARRWLEADNLDLGGKPIEQVETMRGLIELCDYVDFYRARV
jgi:transcriptional regulator with XRE-family HTH domain